MEINKRFTVSLKYTLKSGDQKTVLIPATDFFEFEEFSEEEWTTKLPWRNCTVPEYLPHPADSFRTITLKIADSSLKQERVIHWQFLGETTLTLSWDDRLSAPGNFEIILDTSCGDDRAKVARLNVSDCEVELTSHSMIEGDSLTSLMPET